jgi:dihydrofolate reductase
MINLVLRRGGSRSKKMRNIVVSMFVSLDGVMEDPAWTMPYWNDQIAKFKYEELFASDALLLGRVTYEGFAAAWPSRTDEQGFAERMNSLPKYVVSTTLGHLEWQNSHLITDHVAQEIDRLKRQPGQDILVAGSGQLVQTLIRYDLIDAYRLLVYPVVLGKGQRLFEDGSMATLKLVDSAPLGSGVVALRYEPA